MRGINNWLHSLQKGKAAKSRKRLPALRFGKAFACPELFSAYKIGNFDILTELPILLLNTSQKISVFSKFFVFNLQRIAKTKTDARNYYLFADSVNKR